MDILMFRYLLSGDILIDLVTFIKEILTYIYFCISGLRRKVKGLV